MIKCKLDSIFSVLQSGLERKLNAFPFGRGSRSRFLWNGALALSGEKLKYYAQQEKKAGERKIFGYTKTNH